eukprot:SAG31_NODE_6470_length_2005_cov_1.936516_2_plen_156_part_00
MFGPSDDPNVLKARKQFCLCGGLVPTQSSRNSPTPELATSCLCWKTKPTEWLAARPPHRDLEKARLMLAYRQAPWLRHGASPVHSTKNVAGTSSPTSEARLCRDADRNSHVISPRGSPPTPSPRASNTPRLSRSTAAPYSPDGTNRRLLFQSTIQ